LTNSSGDSENPGVAVSGPVVHVVWFDQRDGNEEIYYKRDSTGGFAVGTGNDKTPDTSQQITIYPNPASNFIHIIPDKHSIQPGILSIRNFSGAELFSSPVEHGESVIDVSGLQTGIYLVEITTGDRPTVSKKLVIQK
jgi:hypothetical protein